MTRRRRRGGPLVAAWLSGIAIASGLLGGSRSEAADPEDRLTFQAGHLDADPRSSRVSLRDGVVLRYGRYRFTGDRLEIVALGSAVSFDGDGRVALCPCPNPPVTLAWSGGKISAPGDLTLRFPRLEIFKVPVFALPWIWIRAPDQPGLLPPILALRGPDGLLVGDGVHIPWRGSDGSPRSLDLSAAGFTRGGVEIGASLLTPGSTARITFDHVQGDRIALEARGSFAASGGAALAWEADAIRGDRARSGTIDLAAAAAPFDHASAEASIRAPGPITALFAGGLTARAGRGDGAGVAGPTASASFGGSLGSLGVWEGGAGGLLLGDLGPGPAGALPVGRASIGAELDGHPGPFALHFQSSGRAFAAGGGLVASEAPFDAAGSARLGLELPLVRSFGATRGEAPLLHWISPAIEVGGIAERRRGDLFLPLFAPVSPGAALVSGGVSTALGRYAGPAVRLSLRVGAVAAPPSPAAALGLARLTAEAPFAAASVDFAATSGPSAGAALIAHARLGAPRGLAVLVDLATLAGADPRRARLVEDIAGASPTGEIAAMTGTGTTLGAAVAVPFPAVLWTTLRADVDLRAGELLALGGMSEYRHPCGCLAFRLAGAHRIGREGLDLTFSVDLTPTGRASGLR